MEPELFEKIQNIEQKVDRMFASVEKLRRYFLWTLIITLVTVVLPIIALMFAIPWAFGILSNAYNIS
ncbi:MAG: hypothetical protein IPK84_00220 [Candidatus Moraniibacteriota bacterium]|nr:MAG: hypothetical protein IPK84_00220 [Candidatus Moranbacteria bacterium]